MNNNEQNKFQWTYSKTTTNTKNPQNQNIIQEGVKYDQDKERFDLIPPEPLFMLAKLYTQGAKKYQDRNWEKGMSWGRIFGAIMRHLWKFWNGEDIDIETGVPHVINAAWGCFALAQYMKTHTELDDRSK